MFEISLDLKFGPKMAKMVQIAGKWLEMLPNMLKLA